MILPNADIIARLQKEIFPLQGLKSHKKDSPELYLGPLTYVFPNQRFPFGAVHEFICPEMENIAATTGFISVILSSVMKKGGVSVWISRKPILFPPALHQYQIAPEKIVLIQVKNEKNLIWVTEQALHCEGIAAVIAETGDLTFKATRRLQLAVETSQVTGFILRNQKHIQHTTACVSRWKISHLPSVPKDELPGIGFPQWNVDLLKIRNGKPGSWQLEWDGIKLRTASVQLHEYGRDEKRKTG